MEAADLFKHMLVGVEPEGLASHAVLRGASLARRLGSRMDLVLAVDVPPPLWPGVSENELAAMHASTLAEVRRTTIERLTQDLHAAREDALAKELGDLLGVHPGHPAKVILRRARELHADLIILGSHAKRSLFDFGSTARAVLARATVPVWTQAEPVTPVQRILVPVDFSDHSRFALEHGLALASRLEASIRLMHCFVPPSFACGPGAGAIADPTYVIDGERKAARESLDKWMEEVEWGSVQADPLFVEGEVGAKVLEAAEGADLIVMGTHGRTGLTRFLMGSVAYAVLKQAQKPVLVVPDLDRTWLLGEDDTEEERDPVRSPASVV